MTSKKKGDILEDLVALLYEVSGANVDVRIDVPCIDAPGSTREIDVLVRPDLVGATVPIVIECKNEKAPVGVERIDAFVGKLIDVGVPREQGIYVSPIGFTSGAVRRADKAGIQLLRFHGLDEERLAAALNDALLGVVHYMLTIESVSMFPVLPTDAANASQVWPLDGEPTPISVHDVVWNAWVTGDLKLEVGPQTLFYKSKVGGAVVDVVVDAYVGSISGVSTELALSDGGQVGTAGKTPS